MWSSGVKFSLKNGKKTVKIMALVKPHGLKFFCLQFILIYLLEKNDIYQQYKVYAFCIDFGKVKGKMCQKMTKKVVILERNHPKSPTL